MSTNSHPEEQEELSLFYTSQASSERVVPQAKPVNVALQGGGAHGAFTWGILDKFLEDGRLEIDGLSGTSAGAMNASVYAYGMMQGGPERAREGLYNFWREISQVGEILSPVNQLPWERVNGFGGSDKSLSYMAFDTLIRMFSPYQFNPLNINPLREILNKHVDFSVMSECKNTKLFIAATNVRTNKIRIFHNHELSADAVMASACLPMLFQAVEIEGEYYWDGGYMGNPALFPLLYNTQTDDILICHINPVVRNEVPTQASDILNRINEISFNSSLIREIRAIGFVIKLLEEDWLKPEARQYLTHQKIHLHSLRADEAACNLSVASKFSPDWKFLQYLRDQGRHYAQEWLDTNMEHVGQRSSVDFRKEFL
jgi:NTE family protein